MAGRYTETLMWRDHNIIGSNSELLPYNEEAERIRLRYKYRKLILTGKLLLPHEDAARLVGPDCAYHLYSQTGSSRKNQKKHTGQRTARQTRRDPG